VVVNAIGPVFAFGLSAYNLIPWDRVPFFKHLAITTAAATAAAVQAARAKNSRKVRWQLL
jgi:hypothetical protein